MAIEWSKQLNEAGVHPFMELCRNGKSIGMFYPDGEVDADVLLLAANSYSELLASLKHLLMESAAAKAAGTVNSEAWDKAAAVTKRISQG